MVWSGPNTYVMGDILTAAQVNEDLRDNMNETEAARAEHRGYLFTQGAVIAEGRFNMNKVYHAKKDLPNVRFTAAGSSDYVVAAPSVTVPGGHDYLVFFGACQRTVSPGGASVWFGVSVDGEEPSLQERFFTAQSNVVRQSGWFLLHDTPAVPHDERVLSMAYGADADATGSWTQRVLTVIPIG